MAIIFSYSPIQSTDVTASDRLILSQMNSDGNPTRSITVGELSKAIASGAATGGPYLPLTAGPTVPLTGDLYMAPTGAGPSVGSNAIVFKGVDDTGAELTSAEIFTLDSTINPSGQDLYFNNADDAGVLQTSLFIDAFQQVAIAKSPATAQLDVGGSFNADGNVTFSGYGSGTKTGVAAYSLAVTAGGLVIEEPTSSGVPWPYQYDVGNGILIQGENPGTTGTDNTALGVAAGLSLTSARQNTLMGRNAGRRITGGNVNTLIGYNAGQNLINGNSNVAIGFQALDSEVQGARSVAVGMNALRFQSNNPGADTYNIGVGYDAGSQMTIGIRNTIMGGLAGNALTTGGRNVAIGYAALGTEDTGGYNTAIGSRALNDQITGISDAYNTAVGAEAGLLVTTGVENTLIGSLAGDSLTTGSNNIIIGYNAEASAAGVDNEITIGSINHDTLRMPGLSTGATDGQVMTYESATDQIKLKDVSTPTFDATNSSASGRIRIGATASASSTSVDAVFIGSDLTNSNNDEQINIGHNNTGTGTQNMIYGSNNTQTGSGAYSILIGTFNQSSGSTCAAIGRNHNLASGNTYTLGESNQSSFTGGVSSAGLMNVSIGYDNQLDVNRGAAFGFANDITGSFGWTLGSGNETVVIGNRLTMSLLGPNRSGTTGPRVIIATGEFIGAAENKKNSVEYYTPEASRSGVFHPALYNSASYADDTAAAAGGVRLGELYRNGSVIQIRMT